MKKVKFKRKSKRIFFSTRIILLILLAIIVSISSAYALLSEKLTITGHINGEMVYTYYFLKPTNWNGSNLKAHIWGDDGTSSTEWPGKSMQYAGTLNGQSVYKVTVTSADPYYSTHKHIIFDDKVNGSDDNDHQTLDISLNPLKNNNQIFNTNLHHTSGTKRIFIRAPKTWNSLNVHLWNGSASDTVWPGISAQKLSEEGYYIEIDPSYKNIIFNYNGSIQTSNLDVPAEQDATFDFRDGTSYSGHGVSGGYYAYGDWADYISNPSFSPSHSH